MGDFKCKFGVDFCSDLKCYSVECEPTDKISLNNLIIVPYAVLHCLSDDDKQVLFSTIKLLIKLSVYCFPA